MAGGLAALLDDVAALAKLASASLDDVAAAKAVSCRKRSRRLINIYLSTYQTNTV